MNTEKKKTKVDLVTGFLGAGKTTFIKKYARYLLDKGCKIGVLENDFGAVNVDMLILQELLDENCDLEMVSAADKDCHRRRFKTKLIAMGMRGLDRVIVEPSGIYEADEFFDVLREEPLDNWYEIGSVITIADACLDTNLSEASDYLLASQLSEAGIVLMSRCQEATKQELEDTLKHLEAVQKKFHCHRMTKPEIIMKDWSELTDDDMERIANGGYEPDSHEKLWFDQDKAYTSLYFMNMKLPDNAMEDAVSRLMSDSKCGSCLLYTSPSPRDTR